MMSQKPALKINWKIPTTASPPKTRAMRIKINNITISVMKPVDRDSGIASNIQLHILF